MPDGEIGGPGDQTEVLTRPGAATDADILVDGLLFQAHGVVVGGLRHFIKIEEARFTRRHQEKTQRWAGLQLRLCDQIAFSSRAHCSKSMSAFVK